MPKLIVCATDGAFLSEPRHESTWEALTELACELVPEKSSLLRRWSRKHVASREEAAAWLEAYFKIRNYAPPEPPVDLSEFYTPLGYDLVRLSKRLNVSVKRASVYVRKLDKVLMLSTAEEVLGAVRHSTQYGHKVGLAKTKT